MLRTLVKPVGGLMLGLAMLAGDDASAQTTGYVKSPVAVVPTSNSSGTQAPVAAASTTTHAAPVTLGYIEPSAAPQACANLAGDCAPGLWVNVDYMLWWMKSSPAPGPLATTGLATDPLPGALGQPSTRVIFGNSEISNNAFNGIRIQAGTWIDERRTIGYEGSYFGFEHKQNIQSIQSNVAGSPLLARPFFNIQTGREEAILLASPTLLAGSVSTTSSSHFSGWDFNAAFNGTDAPDFRADALIGFRALNLAEGLAVADTVTALADQPGQGGLKKGESLRTLDRFNTISNFYGGQLGGRMTWISDRWITTASVKIGLGVTDNLVQLQGAAIKGNAGTNGGNNGPTAGGTLVNYGSAGSYFTNEFTVVPEFNLNLGYRVTQNISLRAGYTILYWSDVVRPGNVVPHAVNPALSPNSPTFGTGALTPTRASLGSADFWTQGVNLGIEFRF